MNLIELNRALRQLRLGGIAAVLEMRLHQAQVESMAPIDLISCLVSDDSPVVATVCWNVGENKLSFAIRKKPSITSTSPSIPR
jgi:hypothetical protein